MSGHSNTASSNVEFHSKVTDFQGEKPPVRVEPGTDGNDLCLTQHNEVLDKLLEQIEPVNFRDMVGLEPNENLTRKHFVVGVVENILALAKTNKWGICLNNGYIYIYNGTHWQVVEEGEVLRFLGAAAEKMGVDIIEARFCQFRDLLYKQFLSAAYLPTPKRKDDVVLINLKNGTFEISPDDQELREHRAEDFLTYMLPFEYNPKASAPMFQRFLNTVLPDMCCQNILSEYLGYVFIHPSRLKMEKCLMLYGTGANGKSVVFEVVTALLGSENVSSYSLQNLTDHNGYQRAELQNKLVNYASEINGKLEASIFKQLVSGEPVEARHIYEKPFTMTHYAKLMFNGNELPKEAEHTNAYYRRFLIIPFLVTIPEDQQDRELAGKIIGSELSGIFNWVLAGLRRLLEQKKFTDSQLVREQVEDYKKQSDSVQLFIEDEGYEVSTSNSIALSVMYASYRAYCLDSGFRPVNIRNFKARLQKAGFEAERKAIGNVIYAKK